MVSKSGRSPAFLIYAAMGGIVRVMKRKDVMKVKEAG